METIDIHGISLPKLGLGTFKLTGDEGQKAVENALALGYRHIDTAEMYDNEEAVGAAIKAAGVPRGDLHVTTKVWFNHLAPDAMRRACDTSLKKLGLDQLDLYLIHWPAPDMKLGQALETLGQMKDEGLIRALGVANFTLPLMREAVDVIGAPIACNQIEYHTFLDQAPMLTFLRGHGIPLVAYSPLGQGRVAGNETLQKIGEKHGVSATQVALKWLLDQDGVIAIPKAARTVSQQANLNAWGITLDDADRAAIKALPKDQRFCAPDFSPEWD